MGNLSATAQSAGFTLNDFVATTVYVTSWDFYPTFDDIYKTYFQEPYPARATVQVAGLVAAPRSRSRLSRRRHNSNSSSPPCPANLK